MTKDQLKALHSTFGRLVKITGGKFSRHDLNLILTRDGGVERLPPSSKDLTPHGFENVMATLEGLLNKYHETWSTHWRDVVERRRRGLATDQQLHEIRERHDQLVSLGVEYTLAALCRRQSNGTVSLVEDLSPVQASGLIEMLKVAIARQPGPVETTHG